LGTLDVENMNYLYTFLSVIAFVFVRNISKKESLPIKFLAYFLLVALNYADLIGVNKTNNVAFVMTIGVCGIEGFDNLFDWNEATGAFNKISKLVKRWIC
jgi:hypothetical protein